MEFPGPWPSARGACLNACGWREFLKWEEGSVCWGLLIQIQTDSAFHACILALSLQDPLFLQGFPQTGLRIHLRAASISCLYCASCEPTPPMDSIPWQCSRLHFHVLRSSSSGSEPRPAKYATPPVTPAITTMATMIAIEFMMFLQTMDYPAIIFNAAQTCVRLGVMNLHAAIP